MKTTKQRRSGCTENMALCTQLDQLNTRYKSKYHVRHNIGMENLDRLDQESKRYLKAAAKNQVNQSLMIYTSGPRGWKKLERIVVYYKIETKTDA